ncbi:MAG TPA: hypothetical protein VK422_01225 [Pyrinomonadaceae bacterium]|nr:hypothetical protein [Pyrinomonadaceae bacterium]
MFLEGVVEDGQIKINSNVKLPDRTKVYIVIPDSELKKSGVYLHAPRLAHPDQAADFEMEMDLEE